MPYSDGYPSCVSPRRGPIPSFKSTATPRRVDSRAGGVAIYVKNDVAAAVTPYNVSSTTQELESAVCCGNVCAVNTADGTVVATVYARPAFSQRDVEDFINDHLGWLLDPENDDQTPVLVVGDFNVVSRQTCNWLPSFMI